MLRQRCPEAKVKTIDGLHVNVISLDIRPLTFVEGEGMCCLLNYLEPGYRLPSRKHLVNTLQTSYERAIVLLKEKLKQDAVALALTTDMWTSNTMDAYMSITSHFISHDWKIVSCFTLQIIPRASHWKKHC